MNYISVDEFLELDKKVQKVFNRWWDPTIGDLYCDMDAYDENNVQCIETLDTQRTIKFDKKHNYYIPLLQMHQLIDFISDKGYKFIGINNFLDGWKVKVFKSMNQFEPDYELNNNDRLTALLEVAISIACN